VEILFLIALIQEIWLAESEGVHWNIRNSVPDGMMMKTRNQNVINISMMKFKQKTD
jgi:hypothetical protein